MIATVVAIAARRALHALMVVSGLLVVTGVLALAVVTGRPHVAWSMRPGDNELTLQLTPGRGPLAEWLLSRSTLSTQSLRGGRLMLPLPPGRTTDVDVVVASLWSTSQHVRVTVPPLPELTGSIVEGDAVTLNFSTPVLPRNAPCGLVHDGTLHGSFAFRRTRAPCADTLEVASVTGEWTSVPVSVPALPPPPPPPAPPPPKTPREIFNGPPQDGVFYITIDDGWYPNNSVLALMQQQHIPITAFLLSDAAATHVDFWKSFLAAGGEIEDHTINHPYMTRLNSAAEEAQWLGAAQRLNALLGVTPQIGRPPYGDVNPNVVASAGRAGLHGVVMWSATMNSGHLATADGRPLHAGSIVLFHWTSDVWQNLQTVLQLGKAAGLHPALLGPALQQTGY